MLLFGLLLQISGLLNASVSIMFCFVGFNRSGHKMLLFGLLLQISGKNKDSV